MDVEHFVHTVVFTHFQHEWALARTIYVEFAAAIYVSRIHSNKHDVGFLISSLFFIVLSLHCYWTYKIDRNILSAFKIVFVDLWWFYVCVCAESEYCDANSLIPDQIYAAVRMNSIKWPQKKVGFDPLPLQSNKQLNKLANNKWIFLNQLIAVHIRLEGNVKRSYFIYLFVIWESANFYWFFFRPILCNSNDPFDELKKGCIWLLFRFPLHEKERNESYLH